MVQTALATAVALMVVAAVQIQVIPMVVVVMTALVDVALALTLAAAGAAAGGAAAAAAAIRPLVHELSVTRMALQVATMLYVQLHAVLAVLAVLLRRVEAMTVAPWQPTWRMCLQ